MDNTNRSDLIFESLTELAEENRANRPVSTPGLPSLKSVLADAGSIPGGAIFLGLAEDGLPVLLNLYDPVPGPILITADHASGKTSLLKMIARAAEYLHDPSKVQYGIITAHPAEWIKFQNSKANAGIYSVHDAGANEILQSLVTWAHNNKGEQQSILLLIDNLEAAVKLGDQAEQNLRWLLLRGPSRSVWPIITLNADRAGELKDWLDFFRTRLFGHIDEAHIALAVTGASDAALNRLMTGSQFSMREEKNWLKFRAPAID
jgi:hypothetical protein